MCCRGRWDSFEVRPLYGGKERSAFWRAALLLAGSLPALNPRASADCRVKKDRRRRSFETVEKTEREIPAKETGASITRFSDGFSGLKHGRRLESAALRERTAKSLRQSLRILRGNPSARTKGGLQEVLDALRRMDEK